MKQFLGFISILFISLTFQARAEGFNPAIIFDMGGKFDKAFNEAAYNGAEKFKKETGISYKEFEITNESQREQALRTLAKRGANIIVIAGFAAKSPLEKVAKEFPKVKFTLIDAELDMPNVQSIIFKEHEGSFLVGALAAMTSKTNKIGFVGGMDIPLIRNFACGYTQGAKYANSKTEVMENMVGTTSAAWNDPPRGAELAKSQFDRGADIVYAAAGATGLGVYQAANDSKKFAIGVDQNQNYLHPGTMLTSMIKHVDVATYNAFISAQKNEWKPGIYVLGLKENGVDWALDEYNKNLISKETEEKINQIRQDIINGKISVVDYNKSNNCPVR
ncbi:MAG: BMP family ABC transporter substrate-binding protein [Alphaproteobacteria bacterium]|nr:BMP family ABC transporter substrate-binding protein [Alphaproteobacteria bacterium]